MEEQQGPKLPFPWERDNEIESFMFGLCNSQVKVCGPELVYGSLYDIIGYGAIEDTMLRHLFVCRLFNPGSKLKTIDYLQRYLHTNVSRHSVYSFIDRLSPLEGNGIKHQVEQISYAHTQKILRGRVSVVFYDMTTLYFEASEEDDLRHCGFSKDGKHSNPQIFLGLLVAAGGNPIGYEVFEGNISEGKTLIPVVEALAERFGFHHPMVVADASQGRGLVIIENCGNEAFVTGTEVNMAGIIGVNMSSEAAFRITNCYNAGAILGARESAALCGWLGSNAEVVNCFNVGNITGVDGVQTFYRGSAIVTNSYEEANVGQQTENVASVTADQVRNGALCYMLNDSVSVAEGPYYQTIGTDLYPVLSPNSGKVFAVNGVFTNDVVGINNAKTDKDGDVHCTHLHHRRYADTCSAKGHQHRSLQERRYQEGVGEVNSRPLEIS